MAPMVATMMADTMPAPRWMPNWGDKGGQPDRASFWKRRISRVRQPRCPASVPEPLPEYPRHDSAHGHPVSVAWRPLLIATQDTPHSFPACWGAS